MRVEGKVFCCFKLQNRINLLVTILMSCQPASKWVLEPPVSTACNDTCSTSFRNRVNAFRLLYVGNDSNFNFVLMIITDLLQVTNCNRNSTERKLF